MFSVAMQRGRFFWLFGQPRVRARAPPPCCGRLQARWRVELLPRISPFAIDLRAPFAARLEARALRRSCAHTPKLGQLVPAARIDGAERARVLCRCGGEGADEARCAAQPAPDASTCGLTPTEEATAAAT
jgi:hypothetical protein